MKKTQLYNWYSSILILVILALLAFAVPASASPQSRPLRIIIFVLDDVGADSLAQVPTPNIDSLAAGGVTFSNAYTHAWCKITRRALLLGSKAGKLSGELCVPVDDSALSSNDSSFVGWFRDPANGGYLTGMIGKNHLGRGLSDSMPYEYSAQFVGFDHWWGAAASSTLGNCNPGNANTFDDGVFSFDNRYETVRQRDRLRDLIFEADSQARPLLAWVGFTDAHSPWNAPSSMVLPPGYVIPPNPTDRDLYEAEIAALDHTIGYTRQFLDPRDWIVVIGDNGTPSAVTEPFTNRAKLTVYQRGVKVPLILYGGDLTQQVITTPVQAYDLPATFLAALGEFNGPTRDGMNILGPLPPNRAVFVHNPAPGANRSRAVIEERYKLIENNAGLEFYDLLLDPLELAPLPLVGADYCRLQAKLDGSPAL